MEPIDYQSAVRQLLARRRRQKRQARWQRLIGLRPTASTALMVLGVGVSVIGWLLPIANVLPVLGLALLILGLATGIIRRRARRVAQPGPYARRPPTGAV